MFSYSLNIIKSFLGSLLLALLVYSGASTGQEAGLTTNQSNSFVKDWRQADPDYEDSEFGSYIYSEPSTPTKLEMLSLLSKETPSLMVFMHAISMGLGIDDVLQAAVRYESSKGRDFAESAVNLLPLIPDSPTYQYSSYELEDLERDDENKPYSVAAVMEKFFDDRHVLRPYPDWFDGQYHFLASAAELKQLQGPNKELRWYRDKLADDLTKRPIFVSLYEENESVLIDGEDRIDDALAKDPNALLPVVFIFNKLNETSVDELGYPLTLRGVHRAYIEKSLMLTPTPEWQLGEYHIYANIDEFYEIFELPEEDDFEPEAWQRLIQEAKQYTIADPSFLFVILNAGDNTDETAGFSSSNNKMYAAWDDPRSEENFKYTHPEDTHEVTLKSIASQGMTFNRPDLIAALKALNVKQVPVVFYYLESARIKPFLKGPRALIQAAIGAGTPNGSFGGSGGFKFPPDDPKPPASPPGIQ